MLQSDGSDGMFDAVISVAPAGIFKPGAGVYQFVTARFAGSSAQVAFPLLPAL